MLSFGGDVVNEKVRIFFEWDTFIMLPEGDEENERKTVAKALR
jgi:hypothetical protein